MLVYVDSMIVSRLAEAKRRLVLRDGARLGVWLAGAGFLPVAAIVASGRIPVWLLAGLPVTGFLLGFAIARWNWRETVDVAREVDRLGGTKDRFVSVIEIDGDSPLSAAAGGEIAAYAGSFRAAVAIELRFPWRAASFAAAMGFLCVIAGWHAAGRDSALAPKRLDAARLLTAAKEAARQAGERDPALEKAEEEIAAALAESQISSDPLRDALSALSDLEQRLARTDGSGAALSPPERAALARALAERNVRAAESVQSGDAEAATDALKSLDPDELQKAIEDAAKHSESARLREMARQGGATARVQIAGALSNAPSASRSQLIESLRQLRMGEGAASGDGAKAPGKPGDQSTAGADNDDAPPGGAPGSDLDKGRGEDIAGEGLVPKRPESPDEALSGVMGDGPAAIALLRAAGGDNAEARRALRAVVDAASAQAEDAVARENILPGSRILVRKYFDGIRPRE